MQTMTDVLNWYWQYGQQREGEYAVPASWLYPLMVIDEQLKYAKQALESKPAIAIWGPSQVGKSVLLSRYLDGLDEEGWDSPLTWDGGTPMRFSSGEHGLNPIAQASDATAVVTRYFGCDEVQDPQYPVELKLLDATQWIYAFAIGYVHKCEPPQIHAYTKEDILNKLEQLRAEGPECEPNPDACAKLFALVTILEALAENDDIRFKNLKKFWPSICTAMFDTTQLSGNAQNVVRLMRSLLWDEEEWQREGKEDCVGAMVQNILDFQERALASWKNRKVFCSLDVARLLMDFGTISRLDPGSNNYDARTVEKLGEITWTDNGREIKLGLSNGGVPLGTEFFGYLQTVIAELDIPIRKERVTNPVFLDLISHYDLIDFPGISANTQKAGSEGTNNAKLRLHEMQNSAELEHCLLTQLSKFGRTLSLVYFYARYLSIDSFLLMTRLAFGGNVLQVPECIETSIQKWASCLGYAHTEDAPLFRDFSFCDKALNTVVNVNANNLSFGGIIEESCRQLNLRVQTGHVFMTNYPWLNAYSIYEQNVDVIKGLLQRDSILPQYIQDWETQLERLVPNDGDGAVDYMLQRICSQVNPDVRLRLVHDVVAKCRQALQQQLESQLPQDDGTQKETLTQILRNMDLLLNDTSRTPQETVDLCYSIKQMMLVEHQILRSKKASTPFKDYFNQMVAAWVENRLPQVKSDSMWATVFENNDMYIRLFLRAIANPSEKNGVAKLEEKLKSLFNSTKNAVQTEKLRIMFALYISNILWTGTYTRETMTRADGEKTRQRMLELLDLDDDTKRHCAILSQSILEPFRQRCDSLEAVQNLGRGIQPGDNKLQELIDNLNAIVESN